MPFTWIRDADSAVHTSTTVAPAAAVVADDQLLRAASVLPKMFAYLRDNAPNHPSLAPAIAETTTAVAAYQSGRADDVQAALRRALQAIEAERRTDPTIPQP
ncbi:hypothetical protein [Cellulomonas fengjieae]|uniref:Uncharacterized protein n=1 Tax=Cellulomonas fengjieae TaxID=2819978 RepID=A0ABS3SJ36_9CELL|nr:hypothetical protein [Cellulomonas fengjieae]MBO3085667.1 hypothetical protein [Cellulomonas fengjieae]QVI67618.1 hypothetical protein KG102_08720 [Cellulomonas fengjieae]